MSQMQNLMPFGAKRRKNDISWWQAQGHTDGRDIQRMRVIFSTLAKQELEEAAHHYELEKPGLGKRFKAEIKRSARVIAKIPRSVVHRAR